METKLKVRLLKYTPEPAKTVAAAAKLCYSPSNIEDLIKKQTDKEAERFVGKLVSMGHESPLEHAIYTFGIEGISRACTHQLVRHRIASYSQQSQRYVHMEDFKFIIPPSIKKAGKEQWFIEKMKQIQDWYSELETSLEEEGYKGEDIHQDARYLLPNAAETKIIVTMNARELLYFFKKRTCNRAQWEIRNMAKEMYKLVIPTAPSIFKHAGPDCVTGVCHEGKMSCSKSDEVKAEFNGIRTKYI